MFAILWFLLLAFGATVSLVWVLEHNGTVLVTWLGYEAKTDILTALLITIIFAAIIFAISYLLARILALKFPNLFRLLFKKSYIKRLENVIQRHWKGLDVISQLMLSLESDDVKTSLDLQKKLFPLIKNPQLNNFFLGKIYYQNKDFSKASEFFAKIENSKFAKIMVLKSKFKLALEQKDHSTAIAYATQILSLKKDSYKIAKTLLSLYRKEGLWQEARILISQYGNVIFADEIQRHEVATINSAIAFDFYKKKDFGNAIKYSKLALKSEESFLPALEIQLKSWIKRGFSFRAARIIKKLWKENPHLIFAEIFDLINRKNSPKNRMKLMQKLTSLNKESNLNELALGIVALRVKNYKEAEEFLQKALEKDKTYRAYKTLSVVEKFLKNPEKSTEYLNKSNTLPNENHYTCSSCGHLSASWKPKCVACKTDNGFEW